MAFDPIEYVRSSRNPEAASQIGAVGRMIELLRTAHDPGRKPRGCEAMGFRGRPFVFFDVLSRDRQALGRPIARGCLYSLSILSI